MKKTFKIPSSLTPQLHTPIFNPGVISSTQPNPHSGISTIPSPLTPLPQCERGRRRGFTLVELIVVITILAILGTIAFISLQNYSREARDSKRIQDVRSLLTKLNVENVKGMPYEDILINKNNYTKQIDGIEKPATSGIIDFEYIREARENFKDPEYGIDYDFATAMGVAQFNGKDQDYNFIEGRYWSEKNNKEIIMGNYYKYQPDDAENLFSGSLYIPDPGIPIVYSCTGTLIENNIVISNDTGLTANTTYQTTNPSGKCYYTCKSGYIGNDCETKQWSGNATDGFIFKNLSGVTDYPETCNELLTDAQFQVGEDSNPYDSTKFVDGFYFIDLGASGDGTPLKVYCDMTTNNGGRTRINKNTSTVADYQRFRDCSTNGYYFSSVLECINPTLPIFSNLRFTRESNPDHIFPNSTIGWKDANSKGLVTGWEYQVGYLNYYTMRDYTSNSYGYNTGRRGTTVVPDQNLTIVYAR